MRFVVVGAGAVGGVVGGYLCRSDQEVAFVARGDHGRAIVAAGLTVRTPTETFVVRPPTASSPAGVAFTADDVVLLSVKSQDTVGALEDLLAAGAPASTPIVCLQNGVANERRAAERFDNVFGVVVMAPTLHLEPGVVEAKAGPVPAILDIGCYPEGADDICASVSAAFRDSGIESNVYPDIMRWKWSKLLMNLGNAIEVVCGPEGRGADLTRAVIGEGRAVLDAAGISYASSAESRERRGQILQMTGDTSIGGSSWQSVMRGADLETDHLTGEIVRLGAEVGVATPLNTILLRRSAEVARAGRGPGAAKPEEITAEAQSG